MATFGHVAAGMAATRLLLAESPQPRAVRTAFGLLALVPDAERAIPGLRHDGPTGRLHTPAAVLAWSGVVGLLARRARLSPIRSSLAALAALGSQPLFDTLTHGKGVPLFWPMSGRHYFGTVPRLPTWKPEQTRSGPGVRSLLGELAWSVPLLLIAWIPCPRRPASRTPGTD